MIVHEGVEYARVSEILQPFTNFGDIDPEVLAKKAALGTNVHNAIADCIEGEFPGVSGKEIGYFESYCKWEERANPMYFMSEARLFNKEKRLTGQVDGVIKMNDKSVLVDFKTSAQESPTWVMQAHLYMFLLDNQIKRALFLKLDRNGGLPKVFEYKFNKNIHIKCMNAVDDFWSKR